MRRVGLPSAPDGRPRRDSGGGGRKWLHWLPVMLLLLGVVAQAVLMQTANLSSQSGSGFAMFSKVDVPASRRIVVKATINGAPFDVQIPDHLRDDWRALRREPTDARARELAGSLLELDWSLGDGIVEAGGQQRLDAVEVVVRSLNASGRTLESKVLAAGQRP